MSGSLKIRDLNQVKTQLPKISFLAEDVSVYDWSPEARPLKDLSRHSVASLSGKNKKTLLVMPSTTGRDIQILKHYGVSAQQCEWTLVERNFEYMQSFKENARKNGFF